MIIIGNDCATQHKYNGLVVLDTIKKEVISAQKGSNDKQKISEAIAEYIKEHKPNKILLCFDAPLGWPRSFSENVAIHTAGDAIIDCNNINEFFMRKTDLFVYEELKKKPLEVTANFIARTTYSTLSTISEINEHYNMELLWSSSKDFDLGFIEVYPSAWLISENLYSNGYEKYKKDSNLRESLLGIITKKYNIKVSNQNEEILINSDHIFDAFICTLCGMDFINNKCINPPLIEEKEIFKEGWIWFKK